MSASQIRVVARAKEKDTRVQWLLIARITVHNAHRLSYGDPTARVVTRISGGIIRL